MPKMPYMVGTDIISMVADFVVNCPKIPVVDLVVEVVVVVDSMIEVVVVDMDVMMDLLNVVEVEENEQNLVYW